MKTIENQQFISGIYEVQDANELLKTIYKSIINYHKIENLCTQVRYDKDNVDALDNIKNFNIELQEIEQTLRIAKLMDKKVKISSFIEISYE
jgi:deoxyadenosine/deoxycytidine kinase